MSLRFSDCQFLLQLVDLFLEPVILFYSRIFPALFASLTAYFKASIQDGFEDNEYVLSGRHDGVNENDKNNSDDDQDTTCERQGQGDSGYIQGRAQRRTLTILGKINEKERTTSSNCSRPIAHYFHPLPRPPPPTAHTRVPSCYTGFRSTTMDFSPVTTILLVSPLAPSAVDTVRSASWKPFRFMDLPAELRVVIYEQLLIVGKVFFKPNLYEIEEGVRCKDFKKYRKPELQLLRVSKKIQNEAEAVYLTK